MRKFDNSEAWRVIPPEEKLELLARAQASGVFTAFLFIFVASTLAVALKVSGLLWASLLISPLVYQYASGKAWRGLRPRLILEYLAARSAARRYAFMANAKDLSPLLIFKGFMEELGESEDKTEELLFAAKPQISDNEVWISLFEDAIVVMEEHPGGARLRFGRLLEEELSITSPQTGEDDYTTDKEVFLTYTSKTQEEKRVRLTSPFPAALVVFEKQALIFQEEMKERIAKRKLDFLDKEEAMSETIGYTPAAEAHAS